MSVASQQHDDIASELKTSFAEHSYIQVENVAAGSTEEYEVTFNVRGLTINDESEIQESQSHVIHITIPFGFPLFPPSCKPLTPIFHPDFDPGAICLGDFWDQDRTCTELIEFLAKMISGHTYSKENAFNEKAADWYVKHANQFPLVNDEQSKTNSEDGDFELDTVQEEDFSTDFDYLSLDSKDNLEEHEEEQKQIFKEHQGYDLELLQERLDQKRFQQLDRELNAIPINVEFDERESLRIQTDKALTESKKLQRKGNGLEASGDLSGALNVYQQAKETVADLYGVEATIQRLQQAISLAESIGQPKEEFEEGAIEEEDAIEELPQKRKFHIDTSKINLSLKYFIIFPILFLGWFGIKTFFANKQATAAQQYFIECKELAAKRQFREAQHLCYRASLEIDYVDSFIYTGKMNRLASDIQKTTTSQEFLKGLEGKILIDGVWIYEDEAIRISPFKTLTGQAEESVDAKDWAQATKLLRQASPLAKTAQERAVVNEMSHTVDFYKTETEAFSEYDTNGCTSAEELLIKAQQKSKDIPFAIRNRHLPEISYRLTKCTFDQLIVEGNKLYESTDWHDALPVYRDALKKIESSPFPERIAIADIKNKISRAELYSSINEGNRAFAANDWDVAVKKYQQAIKFIENDLELAKEEDSKITSKKLSRIILQAKIIRTQQKIKNLSINHQFDRAIIEYQQLERIVRDSNFAKETDFIRILKTVDEEIASLKNQAVIDELKQYLTKNYVDLFVKNYPAASEDTLEEPIATLVLKKGQQVIFKLQATEIGRGRPLTLVMFYAYNTTSKRWKFTSNPDNKK